MIDDEVVAAALQALLGPRFRHDAAVESVPHAPGLYALFGDGQAWCELGLSPARDDQPLYVGKAERSLSGRDIGTHFAAGKTGSSTLRRSLASLLCGKLSLVPIPRNLAMPDGSANFALESTSELRLSDWMSKRLSLATWTRPSGVALDEVETSLVRRFRSPFNLDKVGEPRQRLRTARKQMADLARAWQQPSN